MVFNQVIALVLMFGKYLGQLLPDRFPLYLEYAGRVVAPIFFFLAVESCFKTSNCRRYIIRLYVWASGRAPFMKLCACWRARWRGDTLAGNGGAPLNLTQRV